MGVELVRAAVAANRDVPDRSPGAFQDCRDVIHISMFFDGTGNNKDDDADAKKWSNVARLYEVANLAAGLDKNRTTYPIYISGVGTAFNGHATDWLAKADVWVEDKFLGAGFGGGGDRRLGQGHDMVNERLRQVMIANARVLGGSVARYAAENGQKGFIDLNSKLGKHRLIKAINLSIFGFSRGAALARAFSNQFIGACTKKDETLLYHGCPVRLNFMGLFDTVASFGVPALNARTPFTNRELTVSPLVERCVHYVAAHEFRFSFPVDLIRREGKYAGDWLEKVYPGVHSDVGGGYELVEQGITNDFARIPMREMMSEALSRGVRILRPEDVEIRNAPFYEDRIQCRPETEAAYKRYMGACRGLSGTVEQQITEHMKLYYSANGTLHRKGIENAGDRSRNSSKYKYIGCKGMAHEVAIYRASSKTGGWIRLSDLTPSAFAQYIKIEDWQLAAWDSKANDGVVEFVSRYVHDSKVDFICNAEPFSYFRPRGVEESSISVWEEGGNWISSTGNAAAKAIDSATSAGKQAVMKAAESASGAYDATAHAAREVGDAVQERAHEAADYANQKATEASNAAAKTYDAAAKSGSEAISAGKRTVDELGKDAERIYESGTRWIRQKIKEVGGVGT